MPSQEALIVEDEIKIAEILRDYLAKAGYERTIDSHIKNLRKKLAEHLPGKEVISTIYGVGYKLNASAAK
jgi:DNA-binding response OmpR family regulator